MLDKLSDKFLSVYSTSAILPTNMDDNRWFYSQQYQEHAIRWLDSINRCVNTAVVFIPKTDRPRRLDQMLNDQVLQKKRLSKKTILQVMRLDVVGDTQDIYDLVARELNRTGIQNAPLTFREWARFLKDQNAHLVLILPEAEKYLTPEGKYVFSLLSSLVREYDQTISTLSFFESDIMHPSMLSVLPSHMGLFEKIFYYPLYPVSDTLSLIRYLGKRWHVSLGPKEEMDIVKRCGGHLWLVAEAVREIAEDGAWSFDTEGMIFRIRTVFHSFSSFEQKVIENVLHYHDDFTEEERYSREYLQKMRVLDVKNHCLVEMFGDYLVHEHTMIQMDLTLQGDRLLYNRVPIDGLFSKKEYKVMKLLFAKKGSLVSRDEIAGALWPIHTTELYSDWAIDQTIARLRKQLSRLSISPKILKVVRGKGYLLKIP